MKKTKELNRLDYWKLMVFIENALNLDERTCLELINESEFAIVNDNMALVRTDDFCSIMTAKDGVIVSVKEVSLDVWQNFCE